MDYHLAKFCFIVSMIIILCWIGHLIMVAGIKQAEKLQESINNSMSIYPQHKPQ